ncbi:hypothetical protein DYI22_01250 [Marinobacter lipolyticus]|nr:hypothetical protein [Marinobacter lipolyticus]
MILEDGELIIKRKAKQIKRLDKKGLSLSLDRTSLSHLMIALSMSFSKADGVDELSRRLLKTATIHLFRETFRKQILRKYQKSFQTFRREVGSKIHFEDLLNLGIHREIR